MTAERKAKLKEILMDLLFDIIGGILYAAGIYSFASQAEFAPGGISGLAIIINHFTQWPIGICTLVLNIPIVIICIRTLGKKFFFKSIKTMVISTVIIDFVFPLLPVYKGDALMAALGAEVKHLLLTFLTNCNIRRDKDLTLCLLAFNDIKLRKFLRLLHRRHGFSYNEP